MLQSRQGLLGKMLQTLLRIAQSMKVTVVYSNQVMDEPVLFGGQKPTGGHVMMHAAGTRLQLRKGREGARVAKLIDSLSLPEGEAIFFITAKGIEGKPKKEEE
jgi:DNA repair protein RadA